MSVNYEMCHWSGSDGQEVEEKQEGGESWLPDVIARSDRTAAGTQFINTGT